MNWHYSQNNQKLGPVSLSEIATLLRSGSIDDSTLLWTEGMTDWKPLSAVKRAPKLLESSDMAFCHESGLLYPKEELLKIGDAYVSPERKNAYVQKLQEGTATETDLVGGLNYASFWIRFVAKFVDTVIMGIVNWVIMLVVMTPLYGIFLGTSMESQERTSEAFASIMLMYTGLSYLITFTVGSAYNAFFLPKFGATPGKMITGLKVVDTDGSHLSIGKSIGRYFAEFLSALILLIGYIMAAFDDERRSLHDRICATRVIVK